MATHHLPFFLLWTSLASCALSWCGNKAGDACCRHLLEDPTCADDPEPECVEGTDVCIPQTLQCPTIGGLKGTCCRAGGSTFLYTAGMFRNYCCESMGESRNGTKVWDDPPTFVFTCCLPIENNFEDGTECESGLDCCGGFQPDDQDHPTVCAGPHPITQPQNKRCVYCGTANDAPYNHCQLDTDCCPGMTEHKRVCVGAVNHPSDSSKDVAGHCCGGINKGDKLGDMCSTDGDCCAGLVCNSVNASTDPMRLTHRCGKPEESVSV